MIDLRSIISFIVLMIFTTPARCDSGYELWLNYKSAENPLMKSQYASYLSNVNMCPNRFKKEIIGKLEQAAAKIANTTVTYSKKFPGKNGIIYAIGQDLESLGKEGYRYKIHASLNSRGRVIYIQSSSDKGILYATFELIRHMQCGESLDEIDITQNPGHTLRLLNHCDDLNGEIERDYVLVLPYGTGQKCLKPTSIMSIIPVPTPQ